MNKASSLPVDTVLADLRHSLAGSHLNAVLQAPPGAGKTTRVPLALLEAEWLGNKQIVMLAPRRLAARAAARFMAHRLGEQVGETVGYRVRLDTRVGASTRIEVVTEGVLTRLLQDDPALDTVGRVVFDEFHERSLQGDLGLALCLDSQAVLREDLRLVVMSATLDGAAVAQLLGHAPILTSAGRSYPVDIRYRPTRAQFARQRQAFAEDMLRGMDLGYGGLACELAALLAERDPLRGVHPRDADNRFVLSNGRGALFAEAEPLAAADTIVAVNLDGTGEARILLAAGIHREHLLKYHGELIHSHSF